MLSLFEHIFPIIPLFLLVQNYLNEFSLIFLPLNQILWETTFKGCLSPLQNASGDRPIQFNDLTNVDGIVYFSGNRVAFDKVKYTGTYYGYEIYKLDPATGETTFVEVEPGDKSSNPSNFINVNGTLYFTATTADSGTELWKLDADGKPQKLEIVSGKDSSNPGNFTKFNNTLYFSVLSGSTGAGLYKIDTATGNPVKVADANVFETAIVNGEMYFITGDQGYDIKKIDASGSITPVSLGTLKTGGSLGGQLTSVNNTLYFLTNTVNSAGYFNGTALTKLDASGNPVVFDKMPGIGSGGTVSHLTKIGNELYFVAQETNAGDAKIWKIDAATGNPVEIAPSPIKTNIFRQPIGFESNGVVIFPGAGSLSKLDNSTTATPNNPPVVANAIADTTATVDTEFKFIIPANSFSDPDAGNTLTYSATLADGKALPTWLTFDGATQTFTGTPPEGASNLNLRVKATDNGGLSITDDFSLAIATPTKAPAEKTDSEPKTGGENVGTAEMNGTKTDPETPAVVTDGGTTEVNGGNEEPKTDGENVDPAVTTTGGNSEQPTTTTDGETPVVNLPSGGTEENPIPTNNPADGGGVVEDTPIRGNAPNQRGDGGSTPIPGITLTNNLFQTSSGATGFGISAISRKPNPKVSEIALFTVDDLTGKIDNLAPGSVDYLKAALRRAQPIFSTLNGSFFNSTSTLREIALTADRIYQAIEVEDGSLGDLQQKLDLGILPDNISYSLLDENGKSDIAITTDEDGYTIAIDAGELVLDVLKLADGIVNTPIGAKSQNLIEGRLFDLSEYTGRTLTTNMVTNSSAQYNNQIGFYEVADSSGAIRLDDSSLVQVGEARYAEEAIKKAVANAEFLAGKGDRKTGLSIAGGKIYAPVVVSQGSFQDFLAKNPSNTGGAGQINAYFNYIGANSDKVDHFRLIGNNTFAVEDMHGGGDRDFNDMVVKMDFSL